MKKILFFAATATMLFAACTNEDLVAPQTGAETALEDGAVGFDVYLPGATAQTRAGRAGVMTTGTLQQTGFGIFAYQTDRTNVSTGPGTHQYDFTTGANYMWNQQVNFNAGASGWYYAPLKYWPNETKNDSQSSNAYMPDVTTPTAGNIDHLSFFAYAPWTSGADNGSAKQINSKLEAPNNVAITDFLSKANKAEDPYINYTVATNPDNSVDLLWGVAPVGGLSYTNVMGTTTTIDEGFPLIGLIKPAVNTTLKFQFQHALSRFGVKVVAAVDQVAAGGTFDYGNSKITIEEIRIMGEFGTKGKLNLHNNTKNTPNWTIQTTGNTNETALKIKKGSGLAPHLVYDATKVSANPKQQQVVTGVTTTLADAIKVRSLYDANYKDDCVTAETSPKYDATRPYFAEEADIASDTYAKFGNWSRTSGDFLLHKYVTNDGVSYTLLNRTPDEYTRYPNAIVWENIYKVAHEAVHQVTDADYTAGTYKNTTDYPAYRKVGNTYFATGTVAQIGDYVFTTGPTEVTAPTASSYYKAKPNYFMVIPPVDSSNKTIKVKITYYVSTTDANLADGIVYTKNEVEKEVELPDFKNGRAYELKLILGLTSVKVEAEAADWVTTTSEVNLPQNISE